MGHDLVEYSDALAARESLALGVVEGWWTEKDGTASEGEDEEEECGTKAAVSAANVSFGGGLDDDDDDDDDEDGDDDEVQEVHAHQLDVSMSSLNSSSSSPLGSSSHGRNSEAFGAAPGTFSQDWRVVQSGVLLGQPMVGLLPAGAAGSCLGHDEGVHQEELSEVTLLEAWLASGLGGALVDDSGGHDRGDAGAAESRGEGKVGDGNAADAGWLIRAANGCLAVARGDHLSQDDMAEAGDTSGIEDTNVSNNAARSAARLLQLALRPTIGLVEESIARCGGEVVNPFEQDAWAGDPDSLGGAVLDFAAPRTHSILPTNVSRATPAGGDAVLSCLLSDALSSKPSGHRALHPCELTPTGRSLRCGAGATGVSDAASPVELGEMEGWSIGGFHESTCSQYGHTGARIG